MGNEKKSERKKSKENIVISTFVNESVKLNAETSSQLIQALNGVRYDSVGNDLGHLGRSLKSISKYKINPEYADNNIKQQAGFVAELLTEVEQNKDNILSGNDNRVRTADGLGKANDQINDLYTIDSNGNILDIGQAQSKFLSDHKKAVDNFIKDPKWEKYSKSDMSIPSDQFEKAKEYAAQQQKKYLEQAKKAKTPEAKQKLIKKAQNAETIKNNLVDSGVSLKDAIEARKNPELFTAKKTIKSVHNSSFEMAKGAALVSGSISMGKNFYEVIVNDKNVGDAITDIAKETATASLKTYGIHASATSMSIAMKNSTKLGIRRLGASAAPVAIATATLEIGSSIKRYVNDEIDEEELLAELGEKGAGAVASSYGAVVGTMVLPGIGTIVGGMIGYTISGMIYQNALSILQSEKISEQRRIIIEAMAETAITEMQEYADKLKIAALERKNYRENLYQTFFANMQESIQTNDIDKFFTSIDFLGEFFGLELKFQTFNEFDEFMNDKTTTLTF